ncbi:SAM-dependent methyltransferase [Candidatus Leptofilum sp.]|uniref:SAM-dependent methyltransferase n=1 Tax=Candidatus Leptofilum sp. TaxID=3241576 RepID=UPI003B5BF938
MSKRVIIDADKPLSRSLLWQIQQAYFLNTGMKAWQDDVVPSDISSNPVMARAYSQILFGYLRDCFAAAQQSDFALDASQPINIVELGAGSGRLAYHFLQIFLPKYHQSSFASQPIRYIMTDFVPEILEFWRGHGRFQQYFDAGLLDVALFDVMAMERPFHLQISNQTLTPEAVSNPLILIANYFFDSVPQDSFVIEDGLLCQNLLTLTSRQPEPDLVDASLWDRLELHYEPIPLEKSVYDQHVYNQILDDYEATLPDCKFSFPNVGLDCVQYWQRFGNGRLLLLTSDRGYSQIDALLNQPDPLPNLHGSFSLMVNYHALSEYISRSGGLVCQAPHYQDNIQLLAYGLGQLPQQAQETQLAFAQAVGEGGSPDDFYALKGVVEKVYSSMSLPELLAFLRLSGWDTAVFTDMQPHLKQQLETADPAWYPDVADALHTVWQCYLPLHQEDSTYQKICHLLDLMGYESLSNWFGASKANTEGTISGLAKRKSW